MIDQTKLKHIIDAIKTSTDYHTFDKGKALISNKRIQNGEYDDQNIRINLKGMTSVYSVAAGIQNNKVYYTCSCPAFDANPFFACKHIVALGGFLHKFNETIRRVKTVKYHPEGIPQQTVEKKAIQRTSKFFKLNTLKISEAHLKALNIPKVPENEWLFFIDRTYYSTRLELTHKEDNTRTFTIHAEVLHQSIQLTCNCNEMKDPLCTHEKNAFALFFMENGLLANSFIKDRLASEMASKLLLSAIDIKSLTSLYFAEGEFFIKLTDPQSLERHLYSLLNHKNRFHHEPSIPIIDFEFNLVWFWSLSPREEFRPQLMLGDPYKNKSKGFKSFRAIAAREFNLFHAKEKAGIEYQDNETIAALDPIHFYRYFLLRLQENSGKIPHYISLNHARFSKLQGTAINEIKLDSKLSFKLKDVDGFSLSMLCIDNKGVNPKKTSRLGYSIFYDSTTSTLYLFDPLKWKWILDYLTPSLSVFFVTDSEIHKNFKKLEEKENQTIRTKAKQEIAENSDLEIELYIDAENAPNFALSAKVVLPFEKNAKATPTEDILPALELYGNLFSPVDVEFLERSWQKITSTHPVLRAQDIYEKLLISVNLPDIVPILESIFRLAEEEGWKVYGRESIMAKIPHPVTPRIYSRLFTANEWFSMEIEMKFDDEKLSMKQIMEAITTGKKFILLKNGRTGEIPEKWMKQFARYARVSGNSEGQIHQALSHVINASDFDEVGGDALDFLEGMKSKLSGSAQFKLKKLPKSLKADLRPYQLASYNWMQELSHYGWGGILADDMGLGKTLQAISYMLLCLENKKGPHLIIVPKSLLHNWESEWLNFSNKKPYLHSGNDRITDLKQLKKEEIIITSYGIVLRDIDLLKEINFDTIIYDEAQAVKNPAAKTRKVLPLIKCRFRLAMTGTPVENDLSDLFSIMSLVNPGILGNLNSFQARFKRDNKESLQLLKEMLHPFMLRRLKSQVAKDLPERMVINRIIDMDEEQAMVYETRRRFYHELFQEKSKSDSEWKKSSFLVLQGMNELRQICNSPSLIEGTAGLGSKVFELIDELEELLPNHKVLIFSQYVKMLKLVSHQLDKKGWKYVQLDGQTKDRAEKVQQFQEDEATRIFLISLKAGGTGLNLTEADYVFLLDPWWNPAAENQAIDRAHRIGQSKKVIALKYVCKGSIEEKVLALQDLKKNLVDSVLEVDEEVVKSFDKKRILELFGS